MIETKAFGKIYLPHVSLPIGGGFVPRDFYHIDLSKHNPKLLKAAPVDHSELGRFIDRRLAKRRKKVAVGGYAEQRNLYARFHHFEESDEAREIHLGIDFWTATGTDVLAVLPGTIHSIGINATPGDYGPTVIIEHLLGNAKFHSLYGHLSKESIKGLKKGQLVRRGEKIAELGGPHENVGWPPHLHFQVIIDMGNRKGDYPGVCLASDSAFYLANCPNPAQLFLQSWKSVMGKSTCKTLIKAQQLKS